jgi:hypothetical protein
LDFHGSLQDFDKDRRCGYFFFDERAPAIFFFDAFFLAEAVPLTVVPPEPFDFLFARLGDSAAAPLRPPKIFDQLSANFREPFECVIVTVDSLQADWNELPAYA